MKVITILGGGTAGFCTAAVLSQYVKNNNLDIVIKCVYSSKIGRIGVGESTQLAINDIFQFLRLSDREWMPRCNATYKSNIRFEGWSDDVFYYPFGDLSGEDLSLFFIFCDLFPDEVKRSDFSRVSRYHSRYAELNRLSRDEWDFDELTAYHFDTEKLAKVFYEVCERNGVVFFDDYLTGVEHHDNGDIKRLICHQTGSHYADFFIDCSGFKSLLLGEAMGVPFKSYADTLINNRVVSAKIPYTNKNEQLTSYTNNVTMDNGWCWEIPLWDGISVGYVHSLLFTSSEEINKEFVERYGVEPERTINFTTGRREKAWVKNVASVGLSYGFIEPLEATGLASIVTNVFRLLEVFSTNLKVNAFDRQMYNHSVALELDRSKTFIDMHYAASHKNDTKYWDYVTNRINYPWDQHNCGRSIEMTVGDRDFSNKDLNGGLSFILAGNGYGPTSPGFTKSLGDINHYRKLKDCHILEDKALNNKVLQCSTTLEFLEDTIYEADDV